MNWKALFKNLLFAAVFCCSVLSVSAQHNHFIYIQSNNKKPFNVILNNKNYSSSADGYIIIPKLTDGEYELKVDFAQDQVPEQKFIIKVNNRDAGYALKNFEDKGWGLSNLQTKELILSATAVAATAEATSIDSTKIDQPKIDSPATETAKVEEPVVISAEPPKRNLFGEMLSQVVDDPNLTKETTAKKPKKKAPAVITDSAAMEDQLAKNEINNTISSKNAAENPVDSYEAAKTKGVIKISETTGEQGTDIVFIDFNIDSQDTIRLLIPSGDEKITETSIETTAKPDSVAVNNPVALSDTSKKSVSVETSNPVVQVDTSKKSTGYQSYSPNDKPFLQFPPKTDTPAVTIDTSAVTKTEEKKKEITNPFFNKPDSGNTKAPSENTDTLKSTTEPVLPAQTSSNTSLVNNDCKKMLSDEELAKWKKRMISANSDDEMLKVARKLMPGKCVTTDQVKNLGGLFLSDEGRYQFFDAAYPYTYDFGKYATLESQLFDNYYKKRFKSILRL